MYMYAYVFLYNCAWMSTICVPYMHNCLCRLDLHLHWNVSTAMRTFRVISRVITPVILCVHCFYNSALISGFPQCAAFVLFQYLWLVCAECCICSFPVFMPGMHRVLHLFFSSVYAGYAQSAAFVLFQWLCRWAQSAGFVCFQCFCLVGAEYCIYHFPAFLSCGRRVLQLCFSSVYVRSSEST